MVKLSEFQSSVQLLKSFNQIPGPSPLQLIVRFLPGGKYSGKTFPEFQNAMCEEYGPLVKMPGVLGQRPMLMLFDPIDFEAVLASAGTHPYRKALDSFEYFRRNFQQDVFSKFTGLVTDQGDTWWELRKSVNPIMLKPGMIDKYVAPIDNIATEFVKRIGEIRDDNNEMPDQFLYQLNKWSLESIAYVILERRLGLLHSEENELMQNTKLIFEYTYEFGVMPSIWRYYKTKRFHHYMQTMNDVTDILKGFIEETLKQRQSNTDSDSIGVLDSLLKVNKEVAIVMALDALLAGVDTTSTLAFALLYFLAVNPEKQKILREEVKSVLKHKDSKLTPTSMKKLPYLRACIKETLRMQPIVTGTLRNTIQELTLKGYQIPHDTGILLLSEVLMRKEEYFESPNEFLPERWLRMDKTEDTCPVTTHDTENKFIFMPFGHGTRMCIGRRFAETEVQALTLRVVRNFEIQWHYPPPVYVPSITNLPSSKLKLQFNDLNE